ncbi:MAG: SDR family oxidoreductase, partial [Gammaproteobacteria bacterium]|nr:SDR family oxidoreductase [Gammaproteobacteria bacterium]
GEAIAMRLHTGGYNVILHYRNSKVKAEALAAKFNAQRADSAMLVSGHLNEINAVMAMIAEVTNSKNLFDGRLDVLVNNASLFYPTPIADATMAQWDELVNTNLRAPFLLAQGLTEQLKSTNGCIVNITDIYGNRPFANHPIYSMTKAGLISLTKSLAADLAPEIRTNGISPGAILWPKQEEQDVAYHDKVLAEVPLKRLGKVEDISDTVWYLVNNDYVNGQIIAIDGGKSIN